MNVSLSPELRARLDAHLDAVERALVAGGSTRERRRGVVDDLEAQILDMLAGKSEVPSMSDLEAVLGRLDPPEAYAVEGAGRATPSTANSPVASQPFSVFSKVFPNEMPKPRFCRTALLGFGFIMVSFLAIILAESFILLEDSRTLRGSWGIDGCFVVLLFPFGLLGTLLGWIAFFQIRTSKGALRGTVLALFDGLFYPSIVGALTLFAILMRMLK